MRFQIFSGRLPVFCVILCLDVSRLRLPTVWAVEQDGSSCLMRTSMMRYTRAG